MSQRTPVVEYLKTLPSWVTASREMQRQFRNEMRGRVYGRVETAQAWEWFLAGWQRCNSTHVGEG